MSLEHIRIATSDDPRVVEFQDVPDPVRLREHGAFVAEGRFAVRRLLASRTLRTRALLVTETALDSLHDCLTADDPPVVVYIASRSMLREIGGYDFHQGCLALGERPVPRSVADVLNSVTPPRPVVILEQIGNADNIGGIFRNAAAFGAAAVLLSPGCCDPLYRKSIRTSIGATLHLPWVVVNDWPNGLRAVLDKGYQLVALTPNTGAVCLHEYAMPGPATGVALMLGNEGDGLSEQVIAWADVKVRIAMEPPMNSLNVATTAALALHHLHTRGH